MNMLTESVQCVEATRELPAWKRMGLPGLPVTVAKRQTIDDLSALVCAPDGRPVLLSHSVPTVAEMLSERFGCHFEPVMFVTDETEFHRFVATGIPGHSYTAGVAGLAHTGNRALTVPQREAIATLAWAVGRCNFAVWREPHYTLPALFDDIAATAVGGFAGLPWKAFTEEKAYQIAAFLESEFRVAARVVECDDGFGVAVESTHDFENESTLVKVEYMLGLLRCFDISPAEDSRALEDCPREQTAILKLSSRVAKQAHHQRTVEDTLAAILARLEDPAKPGAGAHTLPTPRKPAPEAPPANKRSGKASSPGKGKATKASA